MAAGTNPVQLTRGIEKTVAALVKELKALSVDVSDDDLANVATVSAGNNEVVRACKPYVRFFWFGVLGHETSARRQPGQHGHRLGRQQRSGARLQTLCEGFGA